MTSFVEHNEINIIICYDNHGDNMRNENLINNVLRELDELIFKYDLTYTLKNINKPKY